MRFLNFICHPSLLNCVVAGFVAMGMTQLFAAEVVKKTPKKAVIKVSAEEAEDFEEGDTIILKNSQKMKFKLTIEQIDDRLITVTGPIEGLDTDDVYRVAGTPPSVGRTNAVGQTTGRMDTGNFLPFYFNFAIGRRWPKDQEYQNLVDFKFGYLFNHLPLGVSTYLTSYTPVFNDDFISKNDVNGIEFGIQAELTQHFGPLRPFLGVRYLLAGNLSGDIESSDAGYTSRATVSEKREKTAALEIGAEYYLSRVFAFSLTAKKQSSSKGSRSISAIVTDPNGTVVGNVQAKDKFADKYDEFLFGITFFGLKY